MEKESSPLEYARSNQLSSNYLAEPAGLLELKSLQQTQSNNKDISRDSYLPSIDFGPDMIIEERLNITKDATILIGSVICLENIGNINSNILSLLEEKNAAKRLRCEFPLLQSDQEVDCKNFGGREDFEIEIQSLRLPLEELDDQKNQSLTWTSELWGLGQKHIDKLKVEKLCLSKEALLYLQSSREYFWTSEDIDFMWNHQNIYKRASSCCRDPITPPLSPITTSSQPYQPASSDSTFQIPLLSDPTSPTEQELQGLESAIFRQDSNALLPNSAIQSWDSRDEQACYVNYVRMCDISSPLENPEDTPETSRLKRDNLEVDETIIPEKFAPEYPNSTVLDSILEVPKHVPNITQSCSEFDTNFVEETLLPAYKAITQKIEQEKLIEADILYRVDVPNIDFSKTEPAWVTDQNATARDSTSAFLQSALVVECLKNSDFSHSGLKSGDDKLRWNPFSEILAQKCHEEHKIQLNNSAWKEFIPSDDSNGVLDSSKVSWKREGLKIVKEDNDDEEKIESCHFQDEIPGNIFYLVKKRKLQIEKEKSSNSKRNTSDYLKADQACSTHRFLDMEQSCNSSSSSGPGLLPGTFSACNAVDNYLQIRGSCQRILKNCSYFNTSDQQKREFQDFGKNQLKKQKITSLRLFPRQNYATLPSPSLCQNKPTSVIVSSTLLERRILINKVEKLLPQLKIIERDFSIHKTTAQVRECVPNIQYSNALGNEADIIVSPTTGFILTTLQKIKQKPLPGHKAQSAIRIRLNSICRKYENIVVFVSEGQADGHPTMIDFRDCLALSELTGFTVSLFKFATVYYIGGGEETLAQWLASFIQTYCVDGISLLQHETHWEIFLRRAGLNAFAAQVIIAGSKEECDLNTNNPEIKKHSGLMNFIKLSPMQRNFRFGHLVGMSVMEKVNHLIDSTWNI